MSASEKILSVLLPAYLCQPSITRAIESIPLALPVEVVVAPDDGSTAYESLQTQYPSVVKVLQPSNKTGPASARNRAFQAATGQFITMLDADDAFAPGAVQEALKLAQRSPAHIAFFRTAYVDEMTGGVVRELGPQPSLGFQDFCDFHGSVHALHSRRHWIPYRDLLSEDVLHDAQMLLAAGGQAPMTQAPYLLHLNNQSLSANTTQDAFNMAYKQIRDEAVEPEIRLLYQARLDMGEAFASSIQTGEGHSFHSFLMRTSAKRTTGIQATN